MTSTIVLATGVGVSVQVVLEHGDPSAADAGTPSPTFERASITPSADAEPRRSSAEPTIATPRVPNEATGEFVRARGASPKVGAGQLVTYKVEVERGIPYDASAFAKAVDGTLAHRRGWTKAGTFAFQRVEHATRRIVLASPKTVDRLCAPLQTDGEVSCRNGDVVAINAVRWAKGARTYPGDLDRYRTYVINHEVGHSLGFAHQPCPTGGKPAPVMLQQTRSLDGCERNPWP